MRVEVIRSTTRSAELQATVDPANGVLYPDLPALQAGRALGPLYYPDLVNMVRRMGVTLADSYLAAGRADLCVMARPHLTDPYLTLHAAERYGFVDQPWPPQYLSVRPRP